MKSLFHKGQFGTLQEYLNLKQSELQMEINGYDPDYLLGISETDLLTYLVDRYSLSAPKLLKDQMYQLDPYDVDIDVSRDPRRDIENRKRSFYVKGTAYTIVIPFEGDATLLTHQPTRFTSPPPQGEIGDQVIQLTYKLTEHDLDMLEQLYKRGLASIEDHLEWVRQDIEVYNRSLLQSAKETILRRKQKILADRSMSSALGIPLKQRDNAPRTYVVPGIKKKPNIVRPVVTTEEPFAPEPVLADEEYKNILNIICNMTHVIEQSPRAFARMGEEVLRTHFLVQLNGQYEGQATGETFNFQGKTDILIKEQGKNIFIAECKFWKGPKGLTETIDQLLSYLSWRDTRTAILLFNRKRNFTNILTKIPETMKEHPCYKRQEPLQCETEFRYIFHQPGDPNREIILTILAFDIPSITTEENL